MNFIGYNIPVHTQRIISDYVEHRYHPGGFIEAVLSNDLFGAVARADKDNLAALPEIVKFIYNQTPSNCWGSKAIVWQYLESKFYEALGEQ